MRKPGGQIRRPDQWCLCSSPTLCPHDWDHSTRSGICTIIVYSFHPSRSRFSLSVAGGKRGR